LKVRHEDTGTQDGDYYVDTEITLEQGKYYITEEIKNMFPISNEVRVWFFDSTTLRWGYVGNSDVGDDDLGIDGQNTTMTDNLMVAFDDAGAAVLAILSTTQKPDDATAYLQAQDGGDLNIVDFLPATAPGTILMYGLVPFSLIANLWWQYNELTLDGGATTATPGVGEDTGVVQLDAQNEGAHKDLTAGTSLPAGTYAFIIRDYGVGAVQNYDARVYNSTDGDYRNEEMAYVTFQAQNAAWTYRTVFFDITDQDVTDGDTIELKVNQPNAGPNTVYIDYFLIVPISNGADWPKDLCHNFVRSVTHAPIIRRR